jgi:rhodanese-related sulfurtransferase
MTRLRRLVACLALILFAAPLLAGPAAPAASNAVPRIDGVEAKRLVDKGEAVLVDVRSKDAFVGGHADGALNIPVSQLADRMKELSKDKTIVAYCTCPAEESSGRAAEILRQNGFTKVAAVKGGLDAWEKAGGKVVR